METIGSLLRSMFYLLRDSPARRDDFTTVTRSTLFPLKFCGTRWLDDVPVAERERALQQVQRAKSRRYSHSTMLSSIYRMRSHQQKLHLFVCIAKILTPFLQKFQTYKPMAPFLREELLGLLKNIMAIFIKKSVLDQATTAAKIDIKYDKNRSTVTQQQISVNSTQNTH